MKPGQERQFLKNDTQLFEGFDAIDLPDEDSQPFESDSQTFAGLGHLRTHTDQELSESEDEGLSSLQDSAYANLNISDALKQVLSMDSSRDMSGLQDDSESDDDSLYRASITRHIDIEKINAEYAKNKSKYANFPLLTSDQQHQEKEPITLKVKKTTRKPREKKKRRDKGKKADDEDIFELQQKVRNRKLAKVFESFAEDGSDSDEQEKKSKKKKKSGRKTRKSVPDQNMVDENGERMIRTIEFLDTDTDSSETDDERALSKKEELEMTKEQERLRRAANARLKPAIVVKSYDEFVKRREQREIDLLTELELKSQREIQQLIQEQKEAERQEQLNLLMKKQKRPVVLEDSDDDDLIIENDPSRIAAAAMQSPDRSRIPLTSHFSPNRPSGIRSLNKSILSRITNEGYARRIKMEENAKAHGKFTSATERAKRLLEQEKNARMIDAQVKSHFEKYGYNKEVGDEDEDEEEDEDYIEDTGEDLINELSGQEEDEEDENEFALDKFKADISHKRKNSPSGADSEEDEDMSSMAMKRWKGKKPKKSIFDESDQEDEVIKKKVAQKPVPAHSISNFFKAKETPFAQQEPEGDKPLSRLKRRTIQPDVDEEDMYAMDIDEPVEVKRRPRSPKSTIPRGPQEKNEFLEEEAEEEEDEFFGAGGEDVDNGENLDEFEEDDLLVHDNDEKIDEAALRDVFNKQDAESDNNFIQRLLTDVTGGGLRKQKAAAEAGLMLDDIDLYDDEDNDLIAIRRAAAARRRKLLLKKGGDPLENLLTNPKTAAFAKAGQAISEEQTTVFLSDSEAEDENEDDTAQSENARPKLIIEEDDDENDEDDLMDVSQEDDHLLVDDFDPMASPSRNLMASPSRNTMTSPIRNTMIASSQKIVSSPNRKSTNSVITASSLRRGGLVSSANVPTVVDEDDEIQIESLQNPFSPVKNRKTKMFKSPVRMERFKRLISETSSTGSDAPRVGFGSLSRSQSQQNGEEDEGYDDNHINTKGSIGGFLASKKDPNESKKSKLSALSKKKSEAFTYVE